MSTWTFTISANFTAATKQEAWDEWVEWLTEPANLEDGTHVTENLPDEYDDGTPSIHLRGTEGQDRESYTDDQDRESYTPEHQHDWWTTGGAWRCNCGATQPRIIGPGI